MKTTALERDAVTMLSQKFVRLIEDHSDALANGLLHKILRSARTESFRKVPPNELMLRVHEIYRNLGEWLLNKSETDIEQCFTTIGARRAQQGVPLSQLIWAITLTKDNLWEFILDEAYPDRIVEVFGRQELLQLLGKFFDWAVYSAALGYERAAEANARTEGKAGKAG